MGTRIKIDCYPFAISHGQNHVRFAVKLRSESRAVAIFDIAKVTEFIIAQFCSLTTIIKDINGLWFYFHKILPGNNICLLLWGLVSDFKVSGSTDIKLKHTMFLHLPFDK